MLKYTRNRLLLLFPTLLGITLVNFALIYLAPGGPSVAGSDDLADTAREASSQRLVREQFRLDEPVWKLYGLWIGGLLRGDLGTSIETREPVLQRLVPALWNTFKLNAVALLVVYLVSIPVGVLAACRRGSALDAALGVALFGLYSLPSFWVGTLLLIFVAGGQYLSWLPARGLTPDDAEGLSAWAYFIESAKHFVLPVATLAYVQFAVLSRYTRTGFIEALGQDYVRTARAKGLRPAVVVWKHAARNSLMPVVTEFGTLLPALISGSIVVETIFSIPGMGRTAVAAVFARDYPMILAINLILAVLTLIGMVVTDLLYAWLDPRIELA